MFFLHLAKIYYFAQTVPRSHVCSSGSNIETYIRMFVKTMICVFSLCHFVILVHWDLCLNNQTHGHHHECWLSIHLHRFQHNMDYLFGPGDTPNMENCPLQTFEVQNKQTDPKTHLMQPKGR